MKVIDLLNKIANKDERENLPCSVYYNGEEYKWCQDIGDYRKYGYNECLLIKSIFGTFDCCGKHNSLYNMLFDEIEIIEEPKIEQNITSITITDRYGNITEIKPMIEDGTKKIENIKLDSEECIEYYEDCIKKHLNTNKKDKMYVKILNEIIDYINKGE